MKKLDKPFTLTIDYQPKANLSICFFHNGIAFSKLYELKKNISKRKIIKLIKSLEEK